MISVEKNSLSGAFQEPGKKVVQGQMWHMGLSFAPIWEGLVYFKVCVCVFPGLGPCPRSPWTGKFARKKKKTVLLIQSQKQTLKLMPGQKTTAEPVTPVLM